MASGPFWAALRALRANNLSRVGMGCYTAKVYKVPAGPGPKNMCFRHILHVTDGTRSIGF